MTKAILITCFSMHVCRFRESVVWGPILQSWDSSQLYGNSSVMLLLCLYFPVLFIEGKLLDFRNILGF